MAATVTFDDGVNTPRTFTIVDETLVILEQFRASFGSTYPSIPDMFKYFLNASCIEPALRQFPTTDVQTALASIAAAQASYVTVLQNAISGAISGVIE